MTGIKLTAKYKTDINIERNEHAGVHYNLSYLDWLQELSFAFLET